MGLIGKDTVELWAEKWPKLAKKLIFDNFASRCCALLLRPPLANLAEFLKAIWGILGSFLVQVIEIC